MFSRSAHLYDLLYCTKDYRNESMYVHRVIQRFKKSQGQSLLDIACGTGNHLKYLARYYDVQGMDVNEEFLRITREKCPNIPLHHGDMTKFRLPERFDAVVCLYGSLAYVKTVARLKRTIKCFVRHTLPGGVIIIEPWFTPDTYVPNELHRVIRSKPDSTVIRMNVSKAAGKLAVLDFHYLVGSRARVEYFQEHHELGLFSDADYATAFRESGLRVRRVSGMRKEGPDRPLYVGMRSMN